MRHVVGIGHEPDPGVEFRGKDDVPRIKEQVEVGKNQAQALCTGLQAVGGSDLRVEVFGSDRAQDEAAGLTEALIKELQSIAQVQRHLAKNDILRVI